MSALHLASLLAALLSLGVAAPTTDDCGRLTQNLTANELPQILGRWILIEGFANDNFYNSILKIMQSTWMKISATADNHTLLIEQGFPALGGPDPNPPEKVRCLRPLINASITDDDSLEIHLKTASVYHKFLHTCSECLAMHQYNRENSYQTFYLYGRNKTVAASDLETFRKQAECLHFLQPAKFHYDPSNELCPE